VPQPLAGQLLGGAEAFLQRGELVPGVLGGGEQRRVLGVLGLEIGQPALHLAVLVLDLRAASRIADSSAISLSSVVRSVCRSSASRRSRASRRSAWMPAARRATSACLPSGLSWRRSSAVRSCSRLRLVCIASSLRSAFSLRLRCLRTPAASSMNARRSSGLACSIASSRPWPTMMCISRPMPESLSSSWMSSRRHELPLISYSLSPDRNIRRVIDTSV
jgi:hypothetical protein